MGIFSIYLRTGALHSGGEQTKSGVLGATAVDARGNLFLPALPEAEQHLCSARFLTVFDFIRVVRPLHRALPEPNWPLSGWLPIAGRPVNVLLVLHADDNVLGIQVLVGWAFRSPRFPMVSACNASCPRTRTSCTFFAR